MNTAITASRVLECASNAGPWDAFFVVEVKFLTILDHEPSLPVQNNHVRCSWKLETVVYRIWCHIYGIPKHQKRAARIQGQL